MKLFKRQEQGRPPAPDSDWWTSKDFGSLDYHWKQVAIEETHKEVCKCGIVWHPREGGGPSSICCIGPTVPRWHQYRRRTVAKTLFRSVVVLSVATIGWFVGCLVAGLPHRSDWYLGAIPFGVAALVAAAMWAASLINGIERCKKSTSRTIQSSPPDNDRKQRTQNALRRR